MSIDLSQKISMEKRDMEAVQRTNLNQMESYTTTKSSSSFDSKGCAIVRSYRRSPERSTSVRVLHTYRMSAPIMPAMGHSFRSSDLNQPHMSTGAHTDTPTPCGKFQDGGKC